LAVAAPVLGNDDEMGAAAILGAGAGVASFPVVAGVGAGAIVGFLILAGGAIETVCPGLRDSRLPLVGALALAVAAAGAGEVILAA